MCGSLVYMHKLHHGYFQNVRNPEEFGFASMFLCSCCWGVVVVQCTGLMQVMP
jgi:hypothetical protein